MKYNFREQSVHILLNSGMGMEKIVESVMMRALERATFFLLWLLGLKALCKLMNDMHTNHATNFAILKLKQTHLMCKIDFIAPSVRKCMTWVEVVQILGEYKELNCKTASSIFVFLRKPQIWLLQQIWHTKPPTHPTQPTTHHPPIQPATPTQ